MAAHDQVLPGIEIPRLQPVDDLLLEELLKVGVAIEDLAMTLRMDTEGASSVEILKAALAKIEEAEGADTNNPLADQLAEKKRGARMKTNTKIEKLKRLCAQARGVEKDLAAYKAGRAQVIHLAEREYAGATVQCRRSTFVNLSLKDDGYPPLDADEHARMDKQQQLCEASSEGNRQVAAMSVSYGDDREEAANYHRHVVTA